MRRWLRNAWMAGVVGPVLVAGSASAANQVPVPVGNPPTAVPAVPARPVGQPVTAPVVVPTNRLGQPAPAAQPTAASPTAEPAAPAGPSPIVALASQPPPVIPVQPPKHEKLIGRWWYKHRCACWSHHDDMGCGSLAAECSFIFGSCRTFYTEPCLQRPPGGYRGEASAQGRGCACP